MHVSEALPSIESSRCRNVPARRSPNDRYLLFVFLSMHTDMNSLIGPIPSQFGNLLNLEELLLYDNLLTGDIDPIFCANGDEINHSFIADLQVDCILNTPIHCSCCIDCH